MQNPVVIFGANQLGRLAKEIFELNEVVVFGFLDDNVKLHNTELDDITILGNTDDEGFLKLIGKKCESFVAVDDTRLKKSLVKMLNEIRHVQPVNAIHKNASVSSKAILGHGNLINIRVVIAPGVHVGHHAIIHAGCLLGVQCKVGDFVQIGAGCTIGHEAEIENEVFIGDGATIVAGVKIGKGARIGAGSVVVSSVEAGATVFGNPAQKIKS